MCVNCGNSGCGGCQPIIPSSPAGAAGKNAYTLTTASFTMPAVDANVTITVSTTGQYGNGWAKALQVIAITGAGYFQVVSTTGLNQITITNLGYAGNATPASTIASGATVAPAGLRGIQGVAGNNGTSGTTVLASEVDTISSATTGSPVNLRSYTLPANELDVEGDAVVVSAYFNHTANSYTLNDKFKITFGGQDTVVAALGYFPVQRIGAGLLSIRIVRLTSTTIRCFTTVFPTFNTSEVYSEVKDLTVNLAATNAIVFIINQATANVLKSTGFIIDKYSSSL